MLLSKQKKTLKLLQKDCFKIPKRDVCAFKDEDNNNLFHLAIIADNEKFIRENIFLYEKLNKENIFTITPKILAKYLNRKKILKIFNQTILDKKIVYKKNKSKIILTEQSFEKKFEVNYQSSISFTSYKELRKLLKKCKKAFLKKDIENESLFRGYYYKDEIENDLFPNIRIEWISDEIEHGPLANSKILKNSYVGEYIGEVRRVKLSDINKNPYCFEYNLGYFKETSFTIDALENANIIRFINHNSNANLTPMPVFLNGLIHIILLANRDILEDEQLFYDYGPNYWKRREDPI